jgi:hypothetical protein
VQQERLKRPSKDAIAAVNLISKDRLREPADHGCRIRIALGDPQRYR